MMLVLHFIGLTMGLGTSFAMLFLSIASSRMDPVKGREFFLNATSVSRMGQVGLVLLLLSGGYLMTPYWATLSQQPLLAAKLVLYLALAALVGILSAKAKKARAGDAEKHLRSMAVLGRLAMLVGIGALILAVMVFH
jgi:uncharacterized membrane protein